MVNGDDRFAPNMVALPFFKFILQKRCNFIKKLPVYNCTLLHYS